VICRISCVKDQLVRGISALATPVFDGFGRLVLCMAAIGPSATLDIDPGSLPAQCLAEAARALSQRLGAPAEAFQGNTEKTPK
jgi:DNA-binding IclR family transcriptional regulator